MRVFKYLEISLLALLLLLLDASLSLCLDLLEEDLLLDDFEVEAVEVVEVVEDLEAAEEEGDWAGAFALVDIVFFLLLLFLEEEEVAVEEAAGAGGGGGAFGILDSSCLSFALLLLDWFDSISFGFLR